MTDDDAELRADLHYIALYAQQLQHVVDRGVAVAADVGCAQRLLALAERVLRAVRSRQGA